MSVGRKASGGSGEKFPLVIPAWGSVIGSASPNSGMVRFGNNVPYYGYCYARYNNKEPGFVDPSTIVMLRMLFSDSGSMGSFRFTVFMRGDEVSDFDVTTDNGYTVYVHVEPSEQVYSGWPDSVSQTFGPGFFFSVTTDASFYGEIDWYAWGYLA